MALMRSDLQETFPAGLSAADPVEAIRRSLRVDGRSLAAGGRSFEAENVFVVAAARPPDGRIEMATASTSSSTIWRKPLR